jgi:hypothetical protein
MMGSRSGPGEGEGRKNRTGLFILVLALLPLVLYHASIRLPFLCDDYLLFSAVSGGSYHPEPDPISAYQLISPELTRESPQTVPWWTSPQTRLHFLRPIATLTLKLDHWLWQNNPAGFHLTNLLIHGMVCVALFLVGRRLFRDDTAAFLGVLIFTSPVSTAFVVAWVADRISLLALLWGLLGLYFHMGFRRDGRKRWEALAWLCFLLAFLSKENGAIFIAVYFLYDFFVWKREQPDRWPGILRLGIRYVLLCIPLFLFIGYFVLAGYGVAGHYSILDEAGTFGEKAVYILKNILLYSSALLFFTPLSHEMNLLLFRKAIYLVPFLVMVLLAVLLFYPGARRRVFFRQGAYPFLLCCLLLSCLPVLTLLPQNRYLYAVSAPFGLMMGTYLLTMKRSGGFGRFTRPLFYGIVGFLVAFPMTVILLKHSFIFKDYKQQTRIVEQTGAYLAGEPADPSAPVNVVFVNLPSWVEVLAIQYAFDFHFGKDSFRVYPLTVSREVPEIEVLDGSGLRVSSSDGDPFLESEWEKLFMVELPDREGFSTSNGLFTATVEEVRDGLVHAIRFDFVPGLADGSTRFFVVEDGEVRPCDPSLGLP